MVPGDSRFNWVAGAVGAVREPPLQRGSPHPVYSPAVIRYNKCLCCWMIHFKPAFCKNSSQVFTTISFALTA